MIKPRVSPPELIAKAQRLAAAVRRVHYGSQCPSCERAGHVPVDSREAAGSRRGISYD